MLHTRLKSKNSAIRNCSILWHFPHALLLQTYCSWSNYIQQLHSLEQVLYIFIKDKSKSLKDFFFQSVSSLKSPGIALFLVLSPYFCVVSLFFMCHNWIIKHPCKANGRCKKYIINYVQIENRAHNTKTLLTIFVGFSKLSKLE